MFTSTKEIEEVETIYRSWETKGLREDKSRDWSLDCKGDKVISLTSVFLFLFSLSQTGVVEPWRRNDNLQKGESLKPESIRGERPNKNDTDDDILPTLDLTLSDLFFLYFLITLKTVKETKFLR